MTRELKLASEPITLRTFLVRAQEDAATVERRRQLGCEIEGHRSVIEEIKKLHVRAGAPDQIRPEAAA